MAEEKEYDITLTAPAIVEQRHTVVASSKKKAIEIAIELSRDGIWKYLELQDSPEAYVMSPVK